MSVLGQSLQLPIVQSFDPFFPSKFKQDFLYDLSFLFIDHPRSEPHWEQFPKDCCFYLLQLFCIKSFKFFHLLFQLLLLLLRQDLRHILHDIRHALAAAQQGVPGLLLQFLKPQKGRWSKGTALSSKTPYQHILIGLLPYPLVLVFLTARNTGPTHWTWQSRLLSVKLIGFLLRSAGLTTRLKATQVGFDLIAL